MKKVKEKGMEIVFLIAACVSILSVALICIFLFMNGIPAIKEIGFFNFVGGKIWKPGNNIFGILPMILGSIYVTAGALVIGVPIGILTAVFLARFCPKKIYKIVKPGVDLLAGIPSVVYGFFGLCVLVPWVRSTFGGNGNSILTASVLLGIMILPSIIGVSESAIRAVPNKYYEGALALGATHEKKCVPHRGSGGKIRNPRRRDLRRRQSDRRDDGSHHGSGKSGKNAKRRFKRCAHTDRKYRY